VTAERTDPANAPDYSGAFAVSHFGSPRVFLLVNPMTANLKILVLALLLLIGATGCSGTGSRGEEQATQQPALIQVADMLRATTKPNGKGPAKLSEFNSLQAVYALGYQAVKTGEVVILWGVGVKGEDQAATGGEIVAYEKNAPTSGGYVLFTSGQVKQLTADEFNAAPKAK
jgi:hypothetical protein